MGMARFARRSNSYIRKPENGSDSVEDTLLMTRDAGLTLRSKLYLFMIIAITGNILITLVDPLHFIIENPLFDRLLQGTPPGGYNQKDDLVIEKGPISRGSYQQNAMVGFQPSRYDYKAEPVRTEGTLPDPQLDLGVDSSRLLVIVMSSRDHFEHRQAIRDSWAKGHSNVIFVVGGPLPEEDQYIRHTEERITLALGKEQEQYHDLLDTIHPDTYRSLPYKLHYAMQWIHRKNATQHFQWVFKVDDDVVVRLNKLQTLVLHKLNHEYPYVVGDIITNTLKKNTGKWAEDPHYQPEVYPPWPRGASGYVFSRPIADYIGRTPNLYYYQGEDVSFGIWMAEARRKLGPVGAYLTFMHSPEFTFEDGCKESHVISGHEMKPEIIKGCFFDHGDTIAEKPNKSPVYREEQKVYWPWQSYQDTKDDFRYSRWDLDE